MIEAEERYYSPERWQNWLTHVEEKGLDSESGEASRLLVNIQNDAAIAIAKIPTAYDDDTLGEEETLGELPAVHDIVMVEPEFETENEEVKILVGSIQTSLSCASSAAEELIIAGPAELEDDMDAYIRAAADTEAADDFDSTLDYTVQVDARVIDGEDLDIETLDELEFRLVTEWANGLDNLQSGLSESRVVEGRD